MRMRTWLTGALCGAAWLAAPLASTTARAEMITIGLVGMMIGAVLVALGGVVGFGFIRNPRRAPSDVKAGDCGGGQLVGSPNVPEHAAA